MGKCVIFCAAEFDCLAEPLGEDDFVIAADAGLRHAEKLDITPANLSILKTGKAKAVRFSTLESICEALNCQPGDILEYIPEKE